MNIKDLNALDEEAKEHDCEHNKLTSAEKYIASLRKSDKTLTDIALNEISGRNYAHGGEIAKNAFYEALDEQKHELLRLVELRLAAKAREQKIKASQKRCIVTASILPVEVKL